MSNVIGNLKNKVKVIFYAVYISQCTVVLNKFNVNASVVYCSQSTVAGHVPIVYYCTVCGGGMIFLFTNGLRILYGISVFKV